MGTIQVTVLAGTGHIGVWKVWTNDHHHAIPHHCLYHRPAIATARRPILPPHLHRHTTIAFITLTTAFIAFTAATACARVPCAAVSLSQSLGLIEFSARSAMPADNV